GVDEPYLVVLSDFPGLSVATRGWRAARSRIARQTLDDRRLLTSRNAGSRIHVVLLNGARHADFTDEFFESTMSSRWCTPWRLPNGVKANGLEVTTAYLKAYFDTYLVEAEGKPIEARPKPYRRVE
ncbi:MAG: hypothetical protein ACRETL_01005, partial [Gammaproteobacteria bacterium]